MLYVRDMETRHHRGYRGAAQLKVQIYDQNMVHAGASLLAVSDFSAVVRLQDAALCTNGIVNPGSCGFHTPVVKSLSNIDHSAQHVPFH